MKKILGLLLAFFIFSTAANALIYIEPFTGISKTSWDSSSSSDTTKGIFGGRLGVSAFLFNIGGEYSKAGSWDKTAIFVAFKPIIIPLRFYGRYFVDAGIASSSNEDDSGYGVGVGFTGLPFISINLDYNKYTDDVTLSGTTTSLDMSEIILSLSLPFDFL